MTTTGESSGFGEKRALQLQLAPQGPQGGGIRTLSLFTGAGGLDIGFHRAGFDIVAAVEIEGAYCKTLRANTGVDKEFGQNFEVWQEDIRDFEAELYSGRGIDCIIGGPPCQTFSAAGRRSGGVLGTADERGRLFEAYCDILRVLKPSVFVFENVYGLPGANGGGPWREIVRAFSEEGYQLKAEVLDAADYGVPQHRERLFLVGYRVGEFQFPMPTHGPDSATKQPFVTSLEAITDLQDSEEPFHDSLGGMYGHLLPLVPEGLNYSFFTKEMGHPEPVFAWRSKFHDLLHKADRHAPVRTIKAQPGKFTGPFHWKNRHFTEQELRRLQSFPDNYQIVGSYSKVVEQIGNSVPPKLAEIVAVSVREQLLERSETLTFSVRGDDFKSTFRQRQRERSRHFQKVAQQEIQRVYGLGVSTSGHADTGDERYRLATDGYFVRRRLDIDEPTVERERTFSVSVRWLGTHVDLKADREVQEVQSKNYVRLAITGLTKYLDQIESLDATSSLFEPSDLFSLWQIIEDALVSRSRFFTLIDIYGHYANRGDTVKVVTEFQRPATTALESAVAFFGNSENCGVFMSRETIEDRLSIPKGCFESVIHDMRKLRYDIRTSFTHPTIPDDRVICTYPFPLLSDRAHLERRVRISEEGVDYELSIAPV